MRKKDKDKLTHQERRERRRRLDTRRSSRARLLFKQRCCTVSATRAVHSRGFTIKAPSSGAACALSGCLSATHRRDRAAAVWTLLCNQAALQRSLLHLLFEHCSEMEQRSERRTVIMLLSVCALLRIQMFMWAQIELLFEQSPVEQLWAAAFSLIL